MEILIVIMLWELSMFVAFVAGTKYKGRKKQTAAEKKESADNEKAIKRMRKEYQNFMEYDGTPQDAISDYE